MRWGNILNGLLLASISVMGFRSWIQLPARVPIHFGVNGMPNRWVDKGGEFLLLFFIPWALTALFYVLALVATNLNPKWINIPNKQKFLELPPEKQRTVFFAMRDFFVWMAVGLNLLFVTTLAGTLLVALGRTNKLPVWSIWPGLALTLAISIGGTVRMFVLVDRLWSERG